RRVSSVGDPSAPGRGCLRPFPFGTGRWRRYYPRATTRPRPVIPVVIVVVVMLAQRMNMPADGSDGTAGRPITDWHMGGGKGSAAASCRHTASPAGVPGGNPEGPGRPAAPRG